MSSHRLMPIRMRKRMPLRRLTPFVGAALVAATATALVANRDVSAQTGGFVTIYPASTTPVTVAEIDNRAVELGVRFAVSRPGAIVGLRYFKSARNTGIHVGTLWDANGHALARARFTNESASGWQQVEFAKAITLTPGVTYVASYHTTTGYYSEQQWAFNKGATIGNTVIRGTRGVYVYGAGGFPQQTWHNSAYYVDVMFQPSGTAPPSSSTTSAPPPTHSSTPTPSPTSSSPTSPPRTSPSSTPTTTPPASSPTSTKPPTSSPTTSTPPPPSTGFPSATTTGVPAGTALTKKSGSITITAAGTVIQNTEIDGCVTLGPNADNVVIKNSLIKSGGCTWLILNDQGATNLTVTDSEFDGQNNVNNDAAIAGYNYTLERVNIHGTGDGGKLGDNVTVKDSYIHDEVVTATSHNDGLQSLGSDTVNIAHNTIITPTGGTSAIILSTGQAPDIRNVTINDNLLAGGAYTVYGGYEQGVDNASKVSNIRIENNQFSTQIFPKGGYYGPLTSDDPPAVSVTGNVWYDGPNKGKPVQ